LLYCINHVIAVIAYAQSSIIWWPRVYNGGRLIWFVLHCHLTGRRWAK